MLYAVLVGGGVLSLLAYVRARRGSQQPGDLGAVSDEWRAEMRGKGASDY
jgi:hypothetical protein